MIIKYELNEREGWKNPIKNVVGYTYCCSEMEDEIIDEFMTGLYMWTGRENETKNISYCPFCGEKIEREEVSK